MSESTEMYLETILVIQKKKGHVRSTTDEKIEREGTHQHG